MERHSMLRPHGVAEVTMPYGEIATNDTCQCCHCGMHWDFKPGSGRIRGYCYGCAALTCGHPNCDPCIPAEVRQENREAGRPELTPRAPKIWVPAGVETLT